MRMRTDKYPCDRCASMVIGDNARQLDGGLLLVVYDYYGGFSDNYADDPVEVALCHECAVSFAREVPKVAALAEPSGGHPWTHLDPCEPCCEFSWPMCGCSDCWDVHVQPCEIIREELL